SVRDDLAYLKSQGWDKDILRHIRLGGKVMGICGGYQMLGKTIDDPDGVEGEPGSSEGLGLLNVHTVLTGSKQLTKTEAVLNLNNQKAKVKGYEIHVGRSRVLDEQPLELDNGECDGAISECGQIMGTYLHGCFDEAEALNLITEWVNGTQVKQQDFEALKEQGINR
ncbi:cobyric acid synthase CobQ, partial [Vibrio sp. Y176]|nr:cobyric acid synthase CobQ [Vibrio sp. Y176]